MYIEITIFTLFNKRKIFYNEPQTHHLLVHLVSGLMMNIEGVSILIHHNDKWDGTNLFFFFKIVFFCITYISHKYLEFEQG